MMGQVEEVSVSFSLDREVSASHLGAAVKEPIIKKVHYQTACDSWKNVCELSTKLSAFCCVFLRLDRVKKLKTRL